MSNLLLVFVVTSTSTLLLSNVYGNYSLDPSNESKGLHCQVTVECKRFWIDTPVCGKGVYTEDGNVVLILVGIDCNGERIHRYNTIWYMIAKSSHIAIRQCRDRLKCTVPEKYLHPKGDRKFVVVVTERNIARHLEIKLKYIKERKLRIHGSTNDRNENYENRQERPQKKDDDLTEKVLRILGDRKYENHKIKEKNQYKKEDNKVHNKKDKIRDDKKVEHVNDSKDGSVNSDKTEKVDNKVRKDSKLRDSRGNVQHINTEDNRLKKNDKLHSENKLLVRGDTKPAMPNHERGQEIRNKKDGPKVPKGNELRGNEKNEDVNHIKIVINRSINYSNESELHDSTKNGIMNLTKTGKNRHNKGNGNKLPAHGENQDGNKISKKSKYENDNVDIHYFIDIIPISELSKTNNSTDSNENDKRDAETIDTILKHKSLDNNSSGFETNSTSITRQNRKNIKNIDLKKSKKITENLIKNLDALLSPESQELDIKEAADDKDFNLIPRPPVLLVDSFKPKSKRARPKYKRPHRTKHLLGNLPKGLKMFKGINHNDRNESLITTTHGDIHDIVDGNEKKKQESLTNTHDKEGNGVLSKNTPGNTPVSTLDFRKEIVDIPSDYKNTYIDSRIDKIPIGQTIVRHIDNPSNLNSTNMGVIYHGTLNNNRTSWHGEYIKVSKHQLRKLQEVFHRRKQQDALKSKLRYNMMNNYIRNTQKQLKEKDQKLKQKEMFDDKKVNDMKKELMIQNISNDEKTREKDKELKAKIVSKVKDLDEEVKELKERNANTQKMKKKDADLKEKGKLHSKKFGTQVSSVRQKVSIPVAPEIDSSVGNDVENGKELIEVVQRKKIFGNVRYPSINRKLVETENFGIKRDGDHNARRLQNDEMKKVPANEIINVMTRNRLYPNKFYPKYHYGIREDMFSQPEILIPLNSHHIINANAEELKQHENLYFHKRIHEDASSLKDRLSCKAASPKIDEQIESALSSIEGNIYRILAEKTQVESKYSNKLQKQVHDATFTVIVDSLNKSCSHRLNANERIGELTNWESWGNCSVECGEGGFQLRKRSCTTNKCVGSLWDVKECSEHKPCRGKYNFKRNNQIKC
ncbi:hypothetical protein LOTGIDRAFT_231104 [Lottia gigantea]|uniref:Uncharacterized protein n=1 Tax=Lottia gigantea TaxID=225164 RepID=V4CC79_LOTGI|nr:hypothetical protein LOTGIDRAFT_231104 [Lottia gigantea]ESO99489.1 hypothetical protein LOTGIDRAFT_231104 [Lottia gigantea]